MVIRHGNGFAALRNHTAGVSSIGNQQLIILNLQQAQVTRSVFAVQHHSISSQELANTHACRPKAH